VRPRVLQRRVVQGGVEKAAPAREKCRRRRRSSGPSEGLENRIALRKTEPGARIHVQMCSFYQCIHDAQERVRLRDDQPHRVVIDQPAGHEASRVEALRVDQRLEGLADRARRHVLLSGLFHASVSSRRRRPPSRSSACKKIFNLACGLLLRRSAPYGPSSRRSAGTWAPAVRPRCPIVPLALAGLAVARSAIVIERRAPPLRLRTATRRFRCS